MTDTDTIDRPATELVDIAEVRDGKPVVAYSRTEAALADLRARYQDAKFDLTTTKGDKAARAARQELVTLRTDLEKRRKQFKAPALEFGRMIDAEAKRITEAIQGLEDPIDAQIKADEARREAERQERERIEQARRQTHLDAIAKLRNYVGLASGVPAARIALGIERLRGMAFGAECEEFVDQYEAARGEALDALVKMHADKVAAEAEELRLAEQRAEQERRQREIEAQEAEIRRRQEELDAAEARAKAEACAIVEVIEQAAAPEVPEPPPAIPPAPPVPTRVQDDGGLRTVSATVLAEQTMVKLGDIQELLAIGGQPLKVTADQLTALGFPPSMDRAAKLYREDDLPRIVQALIDHLQEAMPS